MKKRFRDKADIPPSREERNGRIPIFSRLLMLIGLLTVLYFAVTYLIIPLLALMTVH